MGLPAPVRPLPHHDQPEQEQPRVERPGHLRAVERAPRRQRSPLTLGIICVLALLGILAMQLGLSLATSAGAYVTDDLIVQERELMRIERDMQQQVEMYASPQHLSEEALGLGMVQNARPAYLKLESGVLVGDLNQQTQAPRANLVSNAALAALAGETQADDATAATSEATDTPAATDSAEATTATSTEGGTPEVVKPTGPVPWSGPLEAPQTR